VALQDHRGTIAFALGELTTHVKYLSDAIKSQSDVVSKLSESVLKGFLEQKSAIDEINRKITVAETQIISAFYTSKWFVGIVCLLIGAIFANWTLISSFLHVR
jgi:hypothetical protein